MIAAQSPLVAAVPHLTRYGGHTGIGRVFQSIRAHWAEQIRLVDAAFDTYRLPILRNFPFAVRAPADTQVILLPQLTGAQALRQTWGIPSLVIVHDIGIIDFPGDRAALDWLSYRSIARSFWSMRHASQIVTVSEWTRQRLLHYLPELAERVSVVPSGVDTIFFQQNQTRSEARERVAQMVGHTLDEPLLLYVGTETPRKNLPLLLTAFKRIKAHYPGAQLLKIGHAGHPRWRVKTLQMAHELNLRIGTDLLLVEQIDDALLAAAYHAADVFVSPSLYEGFGLPAMEALAAGTRVVVTNCGAFPEVVGSAGWVAEPEVETFVEAISAALGASADDPRLQTGIARARGYSWERTASEYMQILQTMCGR